MALYENSLDDLDEPMAFEPDCIVIGSGPAGGSVAEHLYNQGPELRILVVEKGPVLVNCHVSNMPKIPNVDTQQRGNRSGFVENVLSRGVYRRQFMSRHEVKPWLGDFEAGMMMENFGGRGIVAGAHLTRFYDDDFQLWKRSGVDWPDRADLDRHYLEAESRRNVTHGECKGRMQNWTLCQLQDHNAHEPPWGVDVASGTNFDIGRGYDSSASRLWSLLMDDDIRAESRMKRRRLVLLTGTEATRLDHQNGRITGVHCRNRITRRTKRIEVKSGGRVVLAASTIESARLAIASGLHDHHRPERDQTVGNYLSEHIFVRTTLEVPPLSDDPSDQFINVVVPPKNHEKINRFHVHIMGGFSPTRRNRVELRMTGEAAMTPEQSNRVRLEREPLRRDPSDYPQARVTFKLSEHHDAHRWQHMRTVMSDIACDLLRGSPNFDADATRRTFDPLEPMLPGQSHHESGTLAMGHSPTHSVVKTNGQFHNVENLYAADASVFPCVGVANPMLTITAIAYHVAEAICEETRRAAALT